MPSRRPELARRAGVALATVLVAAVVGVLAAAHAGAQAGEDLTTPEPDPDAVRAEADRILSGDEFGGEGGPVEGGDVGGSGGDGSGEPFEVDGPSPPTTAPFGGLGAIGQAVVWIVVVAVVAAAAWVIVRAVQARRRRDDDEGEEDEDEVVVDDLLADDEGVRRPADGWLALAEQAEAEGRWRQGLRCRYAALAVALVERGVVEDVPGRTTGEHRQDVAVAAPSVAAGFAEAAELFDRAWYGGLPTGPDEAARFAALAAEVGVGTEAAALAGAGGPTGSTR